MLATATVADPQGFASRLLGCPRSKIDFVNTDRPDGPARVVRRLHPSVNSVCDQLDPDRTACYGRLRRVVVTLEQEDMWKHGVMQAILGNEDVLGSSTRCVATKVSLRSWAFIEAILTENRHCFAGLWFFVCQSASHID